MSTGTVNMSGGDRLAFTFGYGQGKYEHHGTITAKRAGSFNVDGTLIPFLHDQPEIPGDTSLTVDNGRNPPVNAPSPTPTPVASTDKKKKEEDCPQRGKGCHKAGTPEFTGFRCLIFRRVTDALYDRLSRLRQRQRPRQAAEKPNSTTSMIDPHENELASDQGTLA